MSLKTRIALSMFSVVAISGVISAIIGGYLLRRGLDQEASNRVRQDLNAAREFYMQRLHDMDCALRYTALGERFSQAVVKKDIDYLSARLRAVREMGAMDILIVTDSSGAVIHRAQRAGASGDSFADDRLIRSVIKGKESISSPLLIPLGELAREAPALAERSRIRILPTPHAKPMDKEYLKAGIMLSAAARVRTREGAFAGVLWAGVLLNRNNDIVDQVQNTVFRDERYHGQLLGRVTLFQHDVRISTNVLRDDGTRAIGTRVSADVYDHVLRDGKTWVNCAWFLNKWYIAAYAPLYDLDHQTIGMISVGVLERKYRDLALRTLALFGVVVLLVLLATAFVAWRLADYVSSPVRSLASASAKVAQGDFSQVLPVDSLDEIGSLTRTFNEMAQSLKERDNQLKEQTRLQLTRSERLASIGRLAAGVAHEINNPLTGVLTFAHMILDEAPEGSPQRKDAETIIEATLRCRDIVKGLLDFSRQNEPQKVLSDLNHVVGQALDLTRNQASINQIEIVLELDPQLPSVLMDANQIHEVAVNLVVNAIDAMPDGGRLAVRTHAIDGDGARWVEFEVSDTGCGIPDENIEQIFDPFLTTKKTGEGTGLGLAVSYGIIIEHGGRVDVSSEVNQGTTVTVGLPATPKERDGEPEGTDIGHR